MSQESFLSSRFAGSKIAGELNDSQLSNLNDSVTQDEKSRIEEVFEKQVAGNGREEKRICKV